MSTVVSAVLFAVGLTLTVYNVPDLIQEIRRTPLDPGWATLIAGLVAFVGVPIALHLQRAAQREHLDHQIEIETAARAEELQLRRYGSAVFFHSVISSISNNISNTINTITNELDKGPADFQTISAMYAIIMYDKFDYDIVKEKIDQFNNLPPSTQSYVAEFFMNIRRLEVYKKNWNTDKDKRYSDTARMVVDMFLAEAAEIQQCANEAERVLLAAMVASHPIK